MERRTFRHGAASRPNHVAGSPGLSRGLFGLALLASLAGSASHAQTIPTVIITNGSAKQLGPVLRLTGSSSGQSGSAWADSKQFVQAGFENTFQFQITDLVNGGADGFAFVIQNDSVSALGGGGGGKGYVGIPNSLAIEFDTYWNPEGGDPNGNFISVHTRGTAPNSQEQKYSLGITTLIPNLKDGWVHTVTIDYVPGTLQVYMDDPLIPVLTVAVDLSTLLRLDRGRAFVGFTAGTGGAWENHDILRWSFTSQIPQQTSLGTQTAIDQQQAFIKQINALVKAGTLSTAIGQQLITAAQAIIVQLGG